MGHPCQDAGIGRGKQPKDRPDQVAYIQANGHTETETTLNELVTYMVPCELEIAIAPEDEKALYVLDFQSLELFLDNKPIVRSPGCADGVGGDWAEEEKRVVFCDQTCGEVTQSGKSHLSVDFSCVPVVIFI